VSDHRGGRAAGFAMAAGLALVSCSGGEATSVPPTTQAPPERDPTTVESAVVRATGCTIDPRYGRDLDGIRFLMGGFGAADVDPPHDALDGSFTCNVEPAGTLSVGAGRFATSDQAIEMVNWLRGGDPCRPVAAIGPWMLFSGRAVAQPQASADLEAAVSELGGRMTATCR
jgi:hypothetical protein